MKIFKLLTFIILTFLLTQNLFSQTQWWDGNLLTGNMWNINSMRVGINTQSPQYDLHINGILGVNNIQGTGMNGMLSFNNGSIQFGSPLNQSLLNLNSTAENPLMINNSYYNHNIIGFSDLNGWNYLKVIGGPSGSFQFVGQQPGSNPIMSILNSGNVHVNGTFTANSYGDVISLAPVSEQNVLKLDLVGDQSVGIEYSSMPTAKLNIQSPINNNGNTLKFNNNPSRNTFNDGSMGLRIRDDNGNSFYIRDITSGLTRMSISNGKVGINTTSPLLPLTIDGPENGTGIQLGLSPTVTNNYHLISHMGYLQIFNGNHLSGTRIITFRNNGNVGIGVATYNSDAKLSVDGTIKAKEIIVTQNPYEWMTWPDYVFDKSYKLNSIEEVENYVKENGHLEDMPTDEEIKEKGVNLG
jgi:hypothetical protein